MPTDELERMERVPKVAEPPPPPPRSRGRGRAMLIVLLVGVALATAGFLYWRYTQTYESTDDAQVDGHLNSISPRIAGTHMAS